MDTQQQNILSSIYRETPYLNPALRRIAEYIQEHPEQCKTMTIKDLAAACSVAESTVTRFVSVLGLKSYQELKIALAETLTRNTISDSTPEERTIYEGISSEDSTRIIIEKVVYRNIQTLTDTREQLNIDELNRAVEVLELANVIIFCCMGSSSLAAEEGVMRFTRAGKKCLLFGDQSLQVMTAAIAGPGDVVIGISNSGHSTHIVEALKQAQAHGALTIGITSFEDSPLVKHSNISLFTPTKSPPEGPGLYWEATASKSAQILVIDILYACFAARHVDQTREYLEETYRAIKSSRGK